MRCSGDQDTAPALSVCLFVNQWKCKEIIFETSTEANTEKTQQWVRLGKDLGKKEGTKYLVAHLGHMNWKSKDEKKGGCEEGGEGHSSRGDGSCKGTEIRVRMRTVHLPLLPHCGKMPEPPQGKRGGLIVKYRDVVTHP